MRYVRVPKTVSVFDCLPDCKPDNPAEMRRIIAERFGKKFKNIPSAEEIKKKRKDCGKTKNRRPIRDKAEQDKLWAICEKCDNEVCKKCGLDERIKSGLCQDNKWKL